MRNDAMLSLGGWSGFVVGMMVAVAIQAAWLVAFSLIGVIIGVFTMMHWIEKAPKIAWFDGSWSRAIQEWLNR